MYPTFSEELKLFPGSSENLIFLHFDAIETDRLGEWTALTCRDDITIFRFKSRRAMHSHVLVAFLETVVFFDVMKVIASDDDGVLHLH